MGGVGEDFIGVARNHLQPSYVRLQNPLQQEWELLQRVTPDIGDTLGPVEEALRDYFLK